MVSSLFLMSIFVVLSLFTDSDLWVITIPLTAIVFSIFQTYRCKDIVKMLRQALVIQQQIDRAREEAEQRRQAEEEAGGGSVSSAQREAPRHPPMDPDDAIQGSSNPAPA